MGIGGLRNALFRTGAEDAPQMARVLGLLYLSGGLAILLSLLLPHPEEAYEPGLYGIVAVGLVGGTAQILLARWAREWMVHLVLAAGTVFICLSEYFAGVAAGVYSAMFFWVVLMAAVFFKGPAVAAHVAWVVVTWGYFLTTIEDASGFSLATRWALGSLVMVVAASVVSEIVARRRSMESERERLQGELEHLANHDPLTGLANRRLLERELDRELSQAKRRQSPLCVVLLDLDQFKEYNDRRGHVAGDRLLKATASAWCHTLRSADLLARIGGDEFVALLPDCPEDEAERVVDRLVRAVPFAESCSTGIACWDGAESVETLLGRADRAMYRQKSQATGDSVALNDPRIARG